jgi:hypothetical protein
MNSVNSDLAKLRNLSDRDVIGQIPKMNRILKSPQ